MVTGGSGKRSSVACGSRRSISTTCRCRRCSISAMAARMCCWCALQAGEHVGWGECEAAPLVSIASLVCPMSHSACKPVQDSVLGQTLDERGRHRPHRRSGARQQPGRAAGQPHAFRHRHRDVGLARPPLRRAGLQAAGLRARRAAPALCLGALRRHAAGDAGKGARHPRDGLSSPRSSAGGRIGKGTRGRATRRRSWPRAKAWARTGSCWSTPAPSGATIGPRAEARLPALQEARATWLEEPFVSGALDDYRALARAERHGEASRAARARTTRTWPGT